MHCRLSAVLLRLPLLHLLPLLTPQHTIFCTHCCRFIVENYNLRYLMNEVPEKDRLHPVALPAFPSTAPTGHVRRQVCATPAGHLICRLAMYTHITQAAAVWIIQTELQRTFKPAAVLVVQCPTPFCQVA
jgi:hypothetical protein